MESLASYLPTDRRHALAQGRDLPQRASGAALFADISGFTPLTEALVRALGPQRGAEELPSRLNLVYDALITEVDRYRGSVIGFSGDAITCWFDDQGSGIGELKVRQPIVDSAPDPRPLAPAALRAAACALAMQMAMQQFAEVDISGVGVVSLAIKVAVVGGPARRFVVGDPEIQLVDALAGETLTHLAAAEHRANRGEVVIDAPTAAALGGRAIVGAWREDPGTGRRFAVVAGLTAPVDPDPWPPLGEDALGEEQARRWLLPPVYQRLRDGLGEFLTELRPAAALFLRFGGIDFDSDERAGAKLDAYMVWVQRVLARYGGFMLQLTIGDKGCYLYAAFGAPLAHEDDSARATAAALELRAPPTELAFIGPAQIGVSQGRMRTGAYGGSTRRTYGSLGDEVNMAARLMQSAPPGEIYVSQQARRMTADAFEWEPLAPLRVKGKAQPLTVFRLIGRRVQRSIRLQEPRYTLPMIGREDALALIDGRLRLAIRGYGQIVGISGEPGVGKSRLVAEVIRLARGRQVVGYGGECQAYGTNTSYLVWRSIAQDLFGVEPTWPPEAQVERVARELARIDPELLPRLPLLGAVLNLSIPDTELTAGLDARLRKASLEDLLADCLRARAAETPLLLVLEDCHWLDPLSHDLLEAVAQAAREVPLLVLMVYRPPQIERLLAPRVTRLAHFTEVTLSSLPPGEIGGLVQGKLAQLYGREMAAPPELVEQIAARAQGNPFYVEELLNYLHDRGIDPRDAEAVRQIDLPASLHSLILSRIDQLSENQKTLLKVASAIGRLFRAAMLWGVYAFVGDEARVRADLDTLSALELTPLDTPEPELVYLFKHVVTQEVAYESLPYATRAVLHDQIGQYIEGAYASEVDRHLDLLAYHYGRSRNESKQREYLRRAGEAAQDGYANVAARSYFEQLLPLLPEAERAPTLLRLGQVLEMLGQWDEAGARYREALALAERGAGAPLRGQCCVAVGELLRRQGAYGEAAAWYDQAREAAEQAGDRAGIAKVLICAGTLAAQQGDYAGAQDRYAQSLQIRQALADRPAVANLLNNMSIVAHYQGDLARARALQEESLALRRALGHTWGIANSLNNLGMIATDQGEHEVARAGLEEAIGLQRDIGDPSALATSLHTLANLQRTQGRHDEAAALYQEALLINRRLGDRWMLVQLLEDLGWLAALQGEPARALRLVGAAAATREALGAALPPADLERLEAAIAPARRALGDAAEAAWSAGRSLPLDEALDLALGGVARHALPEE